jgi:hypothetical protein
MFSDNDNWTIPIQHEAIPGYAVKEVFFSGCIKAGIGMVIFNAEHD